MGVAETTWGRRWRLLLPALGLSAALVLAACGGDDNGSTSTGGSAAPAKTQAASTQSASSTESPAITDFKSYVGGKAGKATGSPITIGWVNLQGGQADFSPATRGAKATVKYINEELGGVDGHVVKLKTCYIANAEEEGQRCGQLMANDDNVKIVNFGAVTIGNQSYFAQVKGSKVTIVGVSSSPADYKQDNTYALIGSSASVLAPFGTFARDKLHAKTAALVFNQQAGTVPIAKAEEKGLKDAGVKVKTVGFDPQTTDLLGPITAAGSQSADVLVPVTDVPNCINYAKALKSSGLQKPVLSAPLCIAQPVADALGDFPQWTYGIAQDLPGDLSNPTVKAYNDAITKYGASKSDATNVFTALAFSDLLASVKVMNDVGYDNLTTDKLSAAFKSFKGPVIMGPPSLQCGKYPDAPIVCNDQTQFYDYKGKGKFVKVAGWTRPPTSTG
jgi:branched-chain amino acid transport system substrate-binding protein